MGSCEKEQEIPTSPGSQPEPTFQMIGWNEIKSNPKIVEKIGYLMAEQAGRGVNDTMRIEIDTTQVRFIQSEDQTYHSYTFGILNTTPEYPFRNLLFSLAPNGEGYYTYIINFSLSPEESMLLKLGGEMPSFLDNIDIQEVEILSGGTQVAGRGSAGCKPIEHIIISGESCKDTGKHEYGDQSCPWIGVPSMEATPTIHIVIINDCASENPDGVYTNPPPPNPDDGPPIDYWGSGGGTAATTDPVLPPYYQPIKELYLQIANDLPAEDRDDIKAWLHNNPMIAMDISQFLNLYLGDLSLQERKDLVMQGFDFLMDNNYSEEAEVFFWEAIKALMNDGEVDFEERIIYDGSFNDYPCHKQLIKDVNSLSAPLSIAITNAFNSYDGTNLVYQVSSSITANAETSPTSTFNPATNSCDITINFRESFLQTATDVAIANVALHEGLHAILVFLLEAGELPSSNGTDFANLVEAYINYIGGLPHNLGISHHQLMTNFVDDMASALSTYGSNQGYSLSFNDYKNLVWANLMQTSTFQSLYPQYLANGDINPAWLEINNSFAAEQDNATYTYSHPNGNTYVFNPKGTPPNNSEPCN